MEAPKGKYPRFLKCDRIRSANTWNKYLLKPYTEGEIVKVAPMEEQHSTLNTSDEVFRQKYVKVYRKDEDNNYTLPYVCDWGMFRTIV